MGGSNLGQSHSKNMATVSWLVNVTFKTNLTTMHMRTRCYHRATNNSIELVEEIPNKKIIDKLNAVP